MQNENRSKFRMSALWSALTDRHKRAAPTATAGPAKLPLISDIVAKAGREPPIGD